MKAGGPDRLGYNRSAFAGGWSYPPATTLDFIRSGSRCAPTRLPSGRGLLSAAPFVYPPRATAIGHVHGENWVPKLTRPRRGKIPARGAHTAQGEAVVRIRPPLCCHLTPVRSLPPVSSPAGGRHPLGTLSPSRSPWSLPTFRKFPAISSWPPRGPDVRSLQAARIAPLPLSNKSCWQLTAARLQDGREPLGDPVPCLHRIWRLSTGNRACREAPAIAGERSLTPLRGIAQFVWILVGDLPCVTAGRCSRPRLPTGMKATDRHG